MENKKIKILVFFIHLKLWIVYGSETERQVVKNTLHFFFFSCAPYNSNLQGNTFLNRLWNQEVCMSSLDDINTI